MGHSSFVHCFADTDEKLAPKKPAITKIKFTSSAEERLGGFVLWMTSFIILISPFTFDAYDAVLYKSTSMYSIFKTNDPDGQSVESSNEKDVRRKIHPTLTQQNISVTLSFFSEV